MQKIQGSGIVGVYEQGGHSVAILDCSTDAEAAGYYIAQRDLAPFGCRSARFGSLDEAGREAFRIIEAAHEGRGSTRYRSAYEQRS